MELTLDDLNAVKDTKRIMDLMHEGYCCAEIGKKIGKSAEYVHDVVVAYWWDDKRRHSKAKS